MSNSRRQIEQWLKTLEIRGAVVDCGGLFWPVKGRTKTWEVEDYRILDVKPSRKGVIANSVCDLNRPISFPKHYVRSFDHAFCIEVTDHLWDPVRAFTNINTLLKPGGMLYVSSNFLFPHHTGFDCIRFTKTGLQKVLQETGFNILDVKPRFAASHLLAESVKQESKVDYAPGEIGYMLTARKL